MLGHSKSWDVATARPSGDEIDEKVPAAAAVHGGCTGFFLSHIVPRRGQTCHDTMPIYPNRGHTHTIKIMIYITWNLERLITTVLYGTVHGRAQEIIVVPLLSLELTDQYSEIPNFHGFAIIFHGFCHHFPIFSSFPLWWVVPFGLSWHPKKSRPWGQSWSRAG